ncbi:MAG TPA: 16S rRNA (uracil(1498)-N(3))-methyltransferase, partial [Coxiellaceae bacterium]|nr:16S rRNA (uracil(1498)-N(3))-methyltransferase [Coxiellaceae bacterium]
VPEILPAQVLTKWCASAVLASDLRLILDPNATNKLGSIAVHPSSVTILAGPEGGLSNKEIELAKQNNFLPISLGPRILRTETTALAAISVLQAKWGDF